MSEPAPAPIAIAPGCSMPQAARAFYLPVAAKLGIISALAVLWLVLSIYLAQPWLTDLTGVVGAPLAWFIIGGIALVPGCANAFLFTGLLLDRRPRIGRVGQVPPVTVLIAAYNEADCIADTLASFARQRYAAPLEILVIDDGSTDDTRGVVRRIIEQEQRPANQSLRLIEMPRNGGKAGALNAGLMRASHDLIVTVDADTLLFRDAIANLVLNQLQSPPNTAATAGTVLVRNSRKNLLTRLQEWDYFLGIAVVKRVQSLLQGTMVAQGALSIYRKDALHKVGGWQDTVGEDIVLTWALLEEGYRVGYAENALVFTNVPETYGAYYRQRKRWARGLIEAFKRYPGVLTHPRLNTPFVYLNLAFPYLDFVYLFAFVPGVIAALCFGNYLIVGVMTLLLIPLAVAVNSIVFLKQRAIFREHGLRVRRNWGGLAMFTLAYQLWLTPATLMGYLSEALAWKKTW